MKKLLSILVATTVSVSAPLSVVACNSGFKEEISNQIDFFKIVNEFKETISEIFIRNVSNDLSEFTSIFDEDAIEFFDFINFESMENLDNNSDLRNPQSKLFQNMSKDILKVLKMEKMNKEIVEKIVNDVNLKPVVEAGKNPLKQIQISNLSVRTQLEWITINFTFEGEIEYIYNTKGEKTNEILTQDGVINIFKDAGVAESLDDTINAIKTEISDNVSDLIYFSNSGNLDDTANKISKDKNIKNEINDIVSKAKASAETKFSVDVSNAELEVNPSLTQDAAYAAPTLNYGLPYRSDWSPHPVSKNYPYEDYQEYLDLFKPVLTKTAGAEKDLVKKILNENQNLINYNLPNNIQQKLEEHRGNPVAVPINLYILEDNIKNSELGKWIEDSQIDYYFDERIDIKALAVYGAFYSDVKVVNEKSETIDLNDFFIPIKQNTKFASTLKLYEAFLESAIKFQQDLLLNLPESGYYKSGNWKWTDYKVANPEYWLNYTISTSDQIKKSMIDSYKNNPVNNYKNGMGFLTETIDWHKSNLTLTQKELDFNSDFYIADSNSKFQFLETEDLYWTSKNEELSRFGSDHFSWSRIFLFDDSYLSSNKVKVPEFRTYFFTSSSSKKSSKLYFSFGARGDFLFNNWENRPAAGMDLRYSFFADEKAD